MRRVAVVNDNADALDQRTENLMRDVTRQLGHDLERFGFKGGRDEDLFGRVLGSSGSSWPGSSSSTSTTSPKHFPTITTSITTTDTSLGDCATLGIGQESAGKPFSMSFDLRGYDAEEISVACEGEVLAVRARKEVEVNGGRTAKEFNRKVKLPPHVDPEHLNSFFTPEGILTIESNPPSGPPSHLPTCSPSPQSPSAPSIPSPPSSDTTYSSHPLFPTTSSTVASGYNDCYGDRMVSCLSADTSASGSLPLDTPIFSVDSNGVKKMSLVLELGPDYEPGDVTVRIERKLLVVDACRVVTGDGKSSKVSVQRKFDLTDDLDASSVEAELRGGGGRLNVSAMVEKKGKCKVVTG